VTQETDQNYGPFKTQFLSNLDLIVNARLTLKKSLSLQQKFVGLPLFGGVDRDTQYHVEVGAFQKAFVQSKCLAAWKKVGAATPEGVTRACLDNPQVLRNISKDDVDDDAMLMWAIQAANDRAIHALKQAGYAAEYLQATLQQGDEESDRPITQPNTLARQQALANARGHGGRFHVTGGMHVTSDDVFISMEMSVRNEERGKVEKDRKIRQQLQATEKKALALLEQGKPVNLLSVADLDVLLAWHQAPKTKGAKKADKLQQWMAIRADGDPPPAYERWTDEEEQRIVALNAINIDISDTQYGREVAMKKRELEAAADHFNREERDELRKKWDAMDVEDAEEAMTSLQEELRAEATESQDGDLSAV
jgi:hypothetical protein